MGGSRQQTLRRLQRLYHFGYLDRPRAQIDHYRYGSRAMVYGLGNKGMALLEREDGVARRKLDWTASNRTVMRHFIEHTLAVAETMVAVECSCRGTDMELIPYSDTTFRWNVPVRYEDTVVTVGIIPDRVFGLRDKRKPADIAWFFLEADRATMPGDGSWNSAGKPLTVTRPDFSYFMKKSRAQNHGSVEPFFDTGS